MKKIAVLLVLSSVLVFAQQKGSFTDPRNGETYKTVKIGKQIWMAENLNYAASGSKCYNNEILYCDRYGRLYDRETATIVCPKGWHLPNNAEWLVLKKNAYSSVNCRNLSDTSLSYDNNCLKAYVLLKTAHSWNGYSNGTDALGFSALPGGFGLSANDYRRNDSFTSVGDNGVWWSASEHTAKPDYSIGFNIYYFGLENKNNPALHSVRCVKD